MKPIFFRIFSGVLLFAFAGSALALWNQFLDSRRSALQFDKLKEEFSYCEERSASAGPVFRGRISRPGLFPSGAMEDFPFLAAWIKIPGTSVDYPVMQTPKDPDYYLRRGLDGRENRHGVPYLDAASSLESRSLPWIDYGHHMKDGTMFADLLSYEKEEVFRSCRTVWFDTESGPGEYEIFGAFYLPGDADGADFLYEDLSDEERFREKVKEIRRLSLWEADALPKFGSRLLYLVTCEYSHGNGRFLVAAYEKSRE